jgi:hypothetical protein
VGRISTMIGKIYPPPESSFALQKIAASYLVGLNATNGKLRHRRRRAPVASLRPRCPKMQEASRLPENEMRDAQPLLGIWFKISRAATRRPLIPFEHAVPACRIEELPPAHQRDGGRNPS